VRLSKENADALYSWLFAGDMIHSLYGFSLVLLFASLKDLGYIVTERITKFLHSMLK
jgi:hypothetical protein